MRKLSDILKKALSAALAIVILMLAGLPAAAVHAGGPGTISFGTGNIEVIVSTENGGFVVRTLEGDVIAKDDNNKDLLYHSGNFDTSFTSFQVTEGSTTKEYIFGGNYSFLGLGGNNLVVTREDTGIKAVWTVDDLIFTQMLEPMANASSNEHGTVRISYSVYNGKPSPMSVKARLLLDTALGNQDYAYYELTKAAIGGEYERIEKEKVINSADGGYIPANFFAYDDYNNPTTAAYTIMDQSDGSLWPYKIAFGHWNNLASTIFDFKPDGDLTFTNFYNRQYLTADSAFAQYFDPGSIDAGGQKNILSTYYGVDSKVSVKDTDSIGITVTAPAAMSLNMDSNSYSWPEGTYHGDLFNVTTNITNLVKDNAKQFDKVAVAIFVDDGLTPLSEYGRELDPAPTNKDPYRVDIESFRVGSVRPMNWMIRADVLPETSYRKIIFRAYDMSDSPDGLLVLDNLIGSASTYILCPGGKGGPAKINFTGSSPNMVYNKGTRHIFITGTGFYHFKVKSNYVLKAYLKANRNVNYTIPAENIIYSDDEPGVLDIVLKEDMAPGEYELVFEWDSSPYGDGAEGVSITAPVLDFTVTTDETYRNDSYGIVAIVKKGSGANIKYEIQMFNDEAAFRSFEGDVLVVFRGSFTVTSEEDGEILACSAVSNTKKDTVNINGALDFENGNVQIYRNSPGSGGYLMVEFNGDLYTTNSRTAVWSGNASLTPLNDGADYGLIKYDSRGTRIFGEQPQNIISLVWPSGFNMLQTIGGMAVDFRYGQFGAMYDNADDDIPSGYVVSFGGKLDLSFLMPGGSDQAKDLDRKKQQNNQPKSTTTRQQGTMLYSDLDGYSPSEEAKEENRKNKVEPVGKVNIEDVLFGCNKGYIGFNSEAELMLPKYIAALPAMGGKLGINTIGGYAVGVLGQVKTVKLDLEFELKVKSAPDSGRPIPDKIYFYMSGFEPGVNIDGVGAVWITGAGGGVDKLYDTIFSKGGTPPLTLLLSASFDIMKVMSARSDLALSLRGFQIRMRDVKLKNTDKVVINSGTLTTRWDPDFYLDISAYLDLFGMIGGNSYLVVDSDNFFEFFLRANINVPKDVKVIGGMTVGNVDLGGNNSKIWGVIAALGVKVGVTYYWGGDDVHFNTGAKTAKPTYPELLGMGGVPAGVDAKTGRILYMKVGSNISEGLTALLVEDPHADGLRLMAADPMLLSDIEKKVHKLNLGSDDGNDFALTLSFTGSDRPKTVDEVLSVLNMQRPDGSSYPLTFYDGSNQHTANANLVEDSETTTLNITITDYMAGDWNITTSQAADLALYTIGAVPEVTSFTADVNEGTGKLDMNWEGTLLNETRLSFYAVSSTAGEEEASPGTLVGTIGGTGADGSPATPPEAAGQSVSFDIPADLSSGGYYIRMICSKEDEVSQSIVASKGGGSFTFDYINSSQPDIPGSVFLQNSGNDMLKLDIGTPPDGSFSGYNVSIWEVTGEGEVPSDFINIPFEKDEDGNIPEMLLGGRYTAYFTDNGVTSEKTFGLVGGREYVARVSAYRINDGGTPEDPSDDKLVTGAQIRSNQVVLRAATPPVVSFEADPEAYKALSVDTFTTNDVSFSLISDVPVTGQWSIDGTLSQDLLDPESTGLNQVGNVTRVEVNKQLCDGEHTITFSGKDQEGDSFIFSKIIAVDTMAPRLMLTSPINGGFFEQDGTLRIEGACDPDALLTVSVDGETKIDRKTLEELGVFQDAFGVFSYPIILDSGVSCHTVRIMSEDEAGNSITYAAEVNNIGLARINRIDVFKDGEALTNSNIETEPEGNTTADLKLLATTEGGGSFVINGEKLVDWSVTARKGTAAIDESGRLTMEAGSVGFAEGSLCTTENSGMTGAVTFGAESIDDSRKLLMVECNPEEGGSVLGGGLYAEGDTVTISASPNPGYRFLSWSSYDVLYYDIFGDATSATTTLTMPPDIIAVQAMFEPAATYELRASCDPPEGGTVPAELSDFYSENWEIPIEAWEEEGYKFDHWSSSDGGSFEDSRSINTTFTMPPNDTEITAHFRPENSEPAVEYVLTINSDPPEGGVASSTGDGSYTEGDIVTLTAEPEEEYKFDHWSSADGGSFADSGSVVTTFTTPAADTTVTAHFVPETPESPEPPKPPTDNDNNNDNGNDRANPGKKPEQPLPKGEYVALEGEKASIPLPDEFSASPNTVVPYYISEGREIIIAASSVVNGKVIFDAPASTTYYLKQQEVAFGDTGNHWANEAIDFTVARGLFKGMGNREFDPEGQMTRAMFITVISRLDGADLAQFENSSFPDVPDGSWYAGSVQWGTQSGIVNGTGSGFRPDDPVTREQMAVMLNNYLKYKGYKLKTVEAGPQPFTDSDSVSGWALEAVEAMRSLGIIKGKPGNVYDPLGDASRAECSTVFKRIIETITAQ